MSLCPVDTLRSASSAKVSAAALDGLPEELKLHILKQSGPNPYTLLAMQEVNKDWSRIARDDVLWTPLCPNQIIKAAFASPGVLVSPGPQARLGAYLSKQPRGLRRALHQLWHKPDPLVAMTHASCNPLFVCHAALALSEPTKAPWRWSPLHAANQGKLQLQRGVACQS